MSCVCVSLHRLPLTQDCHEMWSRKRRKKEGKDSGGIGPSGKDNHGRSSSLPPTHPSSPRKVKPNPVKAHPQSSQPCSPPDPPPQQPAPRVEPKPLANPHLKPNLTVPLPSAPLNPATILDSLKSSLHEPPPAHVTNSQAPPSLAPQPPQVAGSSTSAVTAVAQQQADHLQKVIEAQRTQLALLSQITQQLAVQQRQQSAELQARRARGVVPSDSDRPGPASPPPPGALSSRIQTFDYANSGSSGLPNLAAPQFDQEYSVRGRWP